MAQSTSSRIGTTTLANDRSDMRTGLNTSPGQPTIYSTSPVRLAKQIESMTTSAFCQPGTFRSPMSICRPIPRVFPQNQAVPFQAGPRGASYTVTRNVGEGGAWSRAETMRDRVCELRAGAA